MRISHAWQVDVDTDPNLIFIDIQFDTGLLRIYASRKRLSVRQAGRFWLDHWQFDFNVWSGFGIFAGKSDLIHRLANAARQLGWPTCARLPQRRAMRLLAALFQAMRHRIMRQLNERTEMLAGVSHDLRTR